MIQPGTCREYSPGSRVTFTVRRCGGNKRAACFSTKGLTFNLVTAAKLKILFVCTINHMRSATAHKIYEEDIRFEVMSAGTDPLAATVLNEELLTWADAIIVMEKAHRNFIRKQYPDIYNTKKIVCLYIPDEFDFIQPELIVTLRDKFEDVHRRDCYDTELTLK